MDPAPILLVYFSVGAAGLIVPGTRELFLKLIPASLLLSLFILFLHHSSLSGRTAAGWIIIFNLGFFLEVAGVRTGWIFGMYTYGPVLGPGFLDTPLLIGANWVLLVYCSQVIAGRLIESLYFRSISAATLMVVFDFALEPAAIKLGMWTWDGGPVTLHNYLAWFLAGFLFNYLAGSLRLVSETNRAATPLFFIQLGFFVLLDLLIMAGDLF